jgi:hypothetical protein
MVGLEEELISSGISKKKAVGVILIVGLFIGALAFSVTFLNLFFDTQRLEPNENLVGAIPQDPILTTPPMPWDPSVLADILDPEDLMDWLEDLDLNMTEEEMQEFLDDYLDDILEQYSDMLDGNIDDLDLSLFAGLIGAFLFSDEEVFRIYDYDTIDNVSGRLWKYECFDEFTGSKWESTSSLYNYNFYRYSDYLSEHPGQDIFNISMPLYPNTTGYSSFVLPNLFPIPFIMRNSVSAPNIDDTETQLSKTDFNSTTLTLDFTSTEDVNMTYELFGLDLPTYDEINSTAVDEDYTPNAIKNQYLQLPPDISTYISAHPHFESHYNDLDAIIQDSDTAAVVGYKIKQYLENNFEFNASHAFSNPPDPDEDMVERFCQLEEGVWSDFVSAYCAFGRAFGLASRYVDGYNTRNLEEVYDPLQDKNAALIKQSNIYNWAEVYVPTATDGSGRWVQVDVCENISPFIANQTTPFNISVSTDPEEIYRGGGSVNISATLSSVNQSVENRVITFRDESLNTIINSVSTDQNGSAWTTVNIDNTHTIGPHYISASYSGAINYTTYTVTGENTTVNSQLTDVSPSTVNISQDPTVNVQGYLSDPVSGNRISYASINFLLFDKNSTIPIPGALTPLSLGSITNLNGEFDVELNIDTSLPSGEYEIRADFNGTWAYYTDTDIYIETYTYINDSSNRMDLNLTKAETYSIWFYMDDIEADNNTSPVISRSSTLELKAKLLNETGGAVSGKSVSFYNYTGEFIGQNTTDSNGVALYYYEINNNIPAGPNRIYARYGGFSNSSYFVLDVPIKLSLSFPDPFSISKVSSPTDPEEFTIDGQLIDDQNNPVRYGYFNVFMYDAGSDESGYLIHETGNHYSSSSGIINVNYSVSDSTPSKNYTISLNFSGLFTYPDEVFPIDLTGIANFSTSEVGDNDLQVYDPYNITILFEINNTATRSTYDDINPPKTYQAEEDILFEIWINKSNNYAPQDSIAYLIDAYTNEELGRHTFDSSNQGYCNFTIAASSLDSGIHKINVRYEDDFLYDNYNFTYIVINESATININQPTSDLNIQRGVDNFVISGDVSDGSYNLRGLIVGLHLFNSTGYDVSDQINFAPGYSQNMTTNTDGTFTFDINSINLDLSQGRYKFRIDFNGSLYLYESSVLRVDLNNHMIHFNSSSIFMDLNAGTQIIQQDYYTLKYEDKYPQYWVDTDTLVVIGNLTWDNSSGISSETINVTVRDLNGDIIAFNDSVTTDQFGGFNVSLSIDESWPTRRSDTEIWVEFISTIEYVESSSKQFT